MQIRTEGRTTYYDKTLHLTETENQGYWLYDTTRLMNLSMHARTKDEAFAEALFYYQRRVIALEIEQNSIRKKFEDVLSALGAKKVED